VKKTIFPCVGLIQITIVRITSPHFEISEPLTMLQHSEERATEDRPMYNRRYSAGGQRRHTGNKTSVQVRNKLVL
jgi:hypothetical protein